MSKNAGEMGHLKGIHLVRWPEDQVQLEMYITKTVGKPTTNTDYQHRAAPSACRDPIVAFHAFSPDHLLIAICKSRMYSQSGASSGPDGWYQASCSVQNSILGSLLDTLHPGIASVPRC